LKDFLFYKSKDIKFTHLVEAIDKLVGEVSNKICLNISEKDSFLDIIHKYKTLFTGTGPIMSNVKNYIVKHSSWKFFMEEIDKLFSCNNYKDWRTDNGHKFNLRSALTVM
jgi:hypothetical protein